LCQEECIYTYKHIPIPRRCGSQWNVKQDKKVLLLEPNNRFRRVNYFKWNSPYHRHQVDMRTANIQRWKYKMKRLQTGLMKSEKRQTGMSEKLSTRLLVINWSMTWWQNWFFTFITIHHINIPNQEYLSMKGNGRLLRSHPKRKDLID
jgi:hypothetical protein